MAVRVRQVERITQPQEACQFQTGSVQAIFSSFNFIEDSLIPRDAIRGGYLTASGLTQTSGSAPNLGEVVSAGFNGSSSYASVALDLSAYNKITLSFWLNWTTFANDDDMALEFTTNGALNTGGFLLDANESSSGKFQVTCKPTGTAAGVQFTRPSAGEWHHYLIGLDLSSAASTSTTIIPFVYIDGVAQSLTGVGSPSNTGTTFANSTLYFMCRSTASLFGAGQLARFDILPGLRSDLAEQASRYPWQLFEPEQIIVPVAASGSTTVTVDAGSLTLTGQSVTNTTTGAVGAGSLSLTGQSIGVVQTVVVTPGTLSLTGQSVMANTTVGVTAGSLTLTGSDVTVVPPSGSVNVAVDPGTLTLTGQSITGTVSVPVTQGDTTLTGQTVGVSITVPVTAGTLTLTGQSVSSTVVGSTTVSVDPGTLTLTGYDVTVTYTGGTKGGAAKGKNLTLKQKKKLKAVISQEWLKAEETAKELFQERLKDAEPAKVKIEKLTEGQSLAEVIVALKALSKETVTLPEQQVVLKSINKTIIDKTEKPAEKINTLEYRFAQFEKQLANIEDLILMVLAEIK